MKKNTTILCMLLLIVCGTLNAQKNSEIANSTDVPIGDIPADPDVKIGTLENGLTYYIRNNGKPEDKVELRLVVNAGSIMETERQLGLAHLQHYIRR